MKKRKNAIRDSRGDRAIKDVISLFLVLYTFITIFLIGSTVLDSFKTRSELVTNRVGWPQTWTVQNYVTVFIEEGFFKYILNSILLVTVSIVLLLIVSAMTAYGLSQYKFRGRGFLESYFLLGLMMPVQLTILPLYLMLSKIGLINNMLSLALIYTANLSFSLTIFNQFFRELPVSVMESARIDGAGDFRIFTSIIIPISRPVFFTVGLLQFIMIWNDFFLPMVFLTRKSSQTLTLAIYSYTCNFLQNWDKIFAAVTVALIPILIVYFIFSEQIVAGLTAGSSKE